VHAALHELQGEGLHGLLVAAETMCHDDAYPRGYLKPGDVTKGIYRRPVSRYERRIIDGIKERPGRIIREHESRYQACEKKDESNGAQQAFLPGFRFATI